jgi:putative two-component system response regulator
MPKLSTATPETTAFGEGNNMMDVLVVDDDSIARRAIKNTLNAGGYNVITAPDGRKGLELLMRHGLQLVVIDWEMPVMDGIEFCKVIRNTDSQHYVYVIMVTARDRSIDTIVGLTVGADDYVTKPFNPGELLMRVNTGQRIIGMESCEMTIFALAKLAESRDSETGAHLERVRSYCRVLAEKLQQNANFREEVDNNYVRLLYKTSPLHDIGKVAIPDSVLLKPGRLTKDEFEIMQTHTLHGGETIESLLKHFPNAGFLKMARDIIISHHEKYDGSGYPHGLVGDSIPLCGRIVAVADVYDALTSKRVYKDSFSHDRARSIIVEGSGQHFDPALVDAFLKTEGLFLEIRERFGCRDKEAACAEEVETPRLISASTVE